MIIVTASGYFDPIHIGHLEYLKLAKKLGDYLIVIVDNDEQAKLKKGKSFMKQEERMVIVGALKYVDEVVLSVDKKRGVSKTLEIIKPDIFAGGGDIINKNRREVKMCKKLGIKMVDKLGKKIQSSSKLTGIKEKWSYKK